MQVYPTELSGENHFVRLTSRSKKLAIIFGAKDLAPYKFNFWQLAQELDANLIFVNNGANRWYQDGIPSLADGYDETVGVFKAWIKTLNISEVYTIGTSMGGYAAIEYGYELDAQILAFASEFALLQPLSRSKAYIQSNVDIRVPDLRSIIKKSKYKPRIFIGESDPRDIFSAAKLLDTVPDIGAISLRGSDHYVPSYLSRSSRLFRVLNQFISNKAWGGYFFDSGEALKSKDYPEKLFKAYLAYKAQDWDISINESHNALKAYAYADAALYILGTALVKTDKPDLAIQYLSMAAHIAPFNADYAFALSNAVRNTGAVSQSEVMLKRNIQRFPNHARSNYALGIIEFKKANYADAYSHVQKACGLSPDNKTFQNRLKIIKTKLNLKNQKTDLN